MTIATIVNVWKDEINAYVAVSVLESGGKNIEYIGNTPLLDISGATILPAQLKINLVAAVKTVRDNQQNSSLSQVGGISGTVAI